MRYNRKINDFSITFNLEIITLPTTMPRDKRDENKENIIGLSPISFLINIGITTGYTPHINRFQNELFINNDKTLVSFKIFSKDICLEYLFDLCH